MVKPHFVASVLSLGLMVLVSVAAFAQNFPNRPIRIVTTPAGGGSDFTSRLIATNLAPNIGQPVIVDNRASTVLSMDTAAKALPDGYTLTVQGGVLWIFPLLQKAPYDALNDFAPITLVSMEPGMLVVHPSVAANPSRS